MCKVYRKATSLKVLEQRAAMEEELKNTSLPSSSSFSSMDTISFCAPKQDLVVFKKEEEEEAVAKEKRSDGIAKEQKKISSASLQLPLGNESMGQLQIPKMLTDWTQDQFWAQLNSPWFQNLTPYVPNILNF